MRRLGFWGREFIYPERPGVPDCAYYMRTGSCGYGTKCRYNHPRDRIPTAKMQNEEGKNMDLYIPRKCSATNRLITAKDHASVQINIGHLDENGVYTGQFTTFALCGFIRAQGDADSAVDRLWQKKKTEVRQQ
ncbi:ribosomal protein S21e [Actinidia rufa]|uniref:Ribosomal protein S21e n=2 Tax=Actinidia TaxID=3624 RepID=A0A7J0GSA6_9ERIC|nr:ribosomal protein S21e [Actinidia rufa]